MDQPITFRFRIAGGNTRAGFFSQRGSFDGETLQLGKTLSIPVERIARVERRAGRIVVVTVEPSGPATAYTLSGISRARGEQLRRSLLLHSSSIRAQMHQDELEARGQGDQFRISVCRHCDATIDQSGFEPTVQSYCPYCDSLTTDHDAAPPEEGAYHECQSCGLYSQPREYTIAYFIFLVAFYYVRWKKVHMCHACIRREGWKMLAGNLPFVLLVPVAIVQLCRAYFGGSARSAAFAGLDTANALARKGRWDEAGRAYETIAQRLPAAAGVHFNHGRTRLAANDLDGAVRQFERAIADCSNFEPALGALLRCYRIQNAGDKLAALEARLRLRDTESKPAATDAEGPRHAAA